MPRKPAPHGLFTAPARSGFLMASILPFCIASAHAMELNFDEGKYTGRFDNTVSYGFAMRTQGASQKFAAETVGASDFYTELATRNARTAANKNDGNTNFSEVGDLVSNTVKWNSLVELNYGKFGGQVSGFAFYDKALDDLSGSTGASRDFINNVDTNDRFDNRRLPSDTENYAVSDARLSSAYVWGDLDLGGHTFNVRFGEQVLSWGEALFMQDGVNQANPADLSALRLPGAEIKDALLPLPMLVVSTNITDSLSTEAFYEFGWKRSEADPVGTFYSTTDAFFGHGSSSVIIDLEDISNGTNTTAAQTEVLARFYNKYARGIIDPTDPRGTRLSNNKLDDVKPRDDGQFGIAMRYLAESLNNTEFGFYFVNYHARKPTAGAVLGEAFGTQYDPATYEAAKVLLGGVSYTQQEMTDIALNSPGNKLAGNANEVALRAGIKGLNAFHYLDSSRYFLQYEENQKVFGFSFATTVGETSFSGEFAYRPDAEFLPEVGDNLIAYNTLNASALATPTAANGGFSTAFGPNIGGGAGLHAGQTVSVSANEDMLNVSLLAIHNFGPMGIVDGLTGVLELGGAWVNGLDDARMYAAEGALGYVTAFTVDSNADGIPDAVPALTEGGADQYLDRFSGGYRIVVAAEFNDVAAGLNLKPQLRYANDVNGNSVVGGNFVDGRKSATIELGGEYSGSWNFALGTNVFWGAYDRNQLQDRDNVYANVKYAF